MSDLVKKLAIKPNQHLLILNPPAGFEELLQPLPDDVVQRADTDGSYDLMLLFVNSKAEADEFVPNAIQSLKANGWLWMCYPKRSSKIKTDITRDVGWDALTTAEWGPVTLVSIDDTWSALRFKPLAAINYSPGSQRYNQKQAQNS